MSKTLSGTLQINAGFTLAKTTTGVGTASFPLAYVLQQAFTAGNGASGKVELLYTDQLTALGGGHRDIDLSSLADPLGDTVAMIKVKLLIIQNINALATDVLTVGGEGTTAAWTSPFGSNADTIKVEGNSILILMSPDGYDVGSSSTNKKLRLAAGANDTIFKIIIIGATA